MKKLIMLILCSTLIFSCKKKEDTNTTVSATPLSTSTTGGTLAATPATFNAVCSDQKIYSISAGNTFSSSTALNFAAFTNSVYNNFNFSAIGCIAAGNISLNGRGFKNQNSYYSDSTSNVYVNPFVWEGTGSVVPAFNFTNTTAFAGYGGYVSWPDTIKKVQGFYITLTSLSRADEARLYVSSMGSPFAMSFTAMVAAGSISVSPNVLASLSTSTPAVLQCDFYKNNIQTIGGQQVNFRNVTTFLKTVEVK